MSIVDYVITERRLVTQFHPICSAKLRRVVGLEALSRGVDEGGTWIPPARLFGDAAREGKILELDRACRDVAIRSFCPLLEIDPHLMLFLNMDAAVVDSGVVGSGYLLRSVQEAGVNPEQIIIEIVESRARNTSALETFADQQRRHGFQLALDDIGTGHSNLERLALIKPDIIKTDRSLTLNVDRELHKQELFGSIVSLAHKLGSVLVAEGIETLESGLVALDRGADLVQGYYFGLPQDVTPESLTSTQRSVAELAGHFREHMVEKVRNLAEFNSVCESVVLEMLEPLREAGPPEFDACLGAVVESFPMLECAYVLDETGEQTSATIFNSPECPRRSGFIFRPADRGADHSIKDYVFSLKTGLRRYVTEPYISMASGHLCQTRSLMFEGRDGKSYILCADFLVR